MALRADQSTAPKRVVYSAEREVVSAARTVERQLLTVTEPFGIVHVDLRREGPIIVFLLASGRGSHLETQAVGQGCRRCSLNGLAQTRDWRQDLVAEVPFEVDGERAIAAQDVVGMICSHGCFAVLLGTLVNNID
jgi:hypothetical protein